MSDVETLLVISLWQPWASWVLWGWKPIDTRTHTRFASLAGKRIGIHAAKRWDDNAYTLASPYLSAEQLGATAGHDHAHGALLCTAFVSCFQRRLSVREEKAALIECATPRSGITLALVEPFNPPIPMIGRQGIWKVPYPLRSS